MKRWEHPERSKSGLRGGIGRGHSEQPQAVLEQGKEGSGLWRQDEAVEEIYIYIYIYIYIFFFRFFSR